MAGIAALRCAWSHAGGNSGNVCKCDRVCAVGGRSGPILPSRTGVRQGCPLSPTLFGLLADGLHTFLQGVAVSEGVALSAGCVLTDLAYADDFVLMSPTASGLQILIDASAAWYAAVGMQPSPAKTVCMELTSPDSPAFHCTCAGHDLQIVSEVKYLGVPFAPGVGVVPVFQQRRARMCGAFAEMKRQYGNLGCAQSVGLRLQLFASCVQSVGSFACDVWGVLPLTGVAKKQRAAIVTTHLGKVKELAGLRRTTPTDIVHAELDEMPLDSVWLLRAAKLWNALVAGSAFYATVLKDAVALSHLGCRNWVTGLKHRLASVGYVFDLEADALPDIDSVCLRSKLRTLAHVPWLNLHESPRLAPTVGSRLCTYHRWFAGPRSGHQPITMLPVSAKVVKSLLRFRTGCLGLPRDIGSRTGVARCDRICTLCSVGLGDEMHMIFECEQLCDLREAHAGLFRGITTMKEFMWQRDLHGVAAFVDQCLLRHEQQ